jgi:hypothetical protein
MRDAILDRAFEKRRAVTRVAEECGISTAAVAKWTRVPKGRFEAFASATGIPVAEIEAFYAAAPKRRAQ